MSREDQNRDKPASGIQGKPGAPEDRPGLPNQDSVIGTGAVVSPRGNCYRVLRTNETDAYDAPDAKSGTEKSSDRP